MCLLLYRRSRLITILTAANDHPPCPLDSLWLKCAWNRYDTWPLHKIRTVEFASRKGLQHVSFQCSWLCHTEFGALFSINNKPGTLIILKHQHVSERWNIILHDAKTVDINDSTMRWASMFRLTVQNAENYRRHRAKLCSSPACSNICVTRRQSTGQTNTTNEIGRYLHPNFIWPLERRTDPI